MANTGSLQNGQEHVPEQYAGKSQERLRVCSEECSSNIGCANEVLQQSEQLPNRLMIMLCSSSPAATSGNIGVNTKYLSLVTSVTSTSV
jgi:hypothetical protein